MGINYSEIFHKTLFETLRWVTINMWYWFLIPLGIFIIQIYFAKKYKVYSADDFVYWVISSIRERKGSEPIYLKGEKYPAVFEWISPSEYKFGKLGFITFREGNNDRCFIFHMLTEAKGEEVRVQKIASLTGSTSNQVRVVLHELSRKLQKDPNLKPFFDVIATNEGAYKIAVKPTYSASR